MERLIFRKLLLKSISTSPQVGKHHQAHSYTNTYIRKVPQHYFVKKGIASTVKTHGQPFPNAVSGYVDCEKNKDISRLCRSLCPDVTQLRGGNQCGGPFEARKPFKCPSYVKSQYSLLCVGTPLYSTHISEQSLCEKINRPMYSYRTFSTSAVALKKKLLKCQKREPKPPKPKKKPPPRRLHCYKICMPCCKPAKDPARCSIPVDLPPCEKVPNPRPAFSECGFKFKPLKPCECDFKLPICHKDKCRDD